MTFDELEKLNLRELALSYYNKGQCSVCTTRSITDKKQDINLYVVENFGIYSMCKKHANDLRERPDSFKVTDLDIKDIFTLKAL